MFYAARGLEEPRAPEARGSDAVSRGAAVSTRETTAPPRDTLSSERARAAGLAAGAVAEGGLAHGPWPRSTVLAAGGMRAAVEGRLQARLGRLPGADADATSAEELPFRYEDQGTDEDSPGGHAAQLLSEEDPPSVPALTGSGTGTMPVRTEESATRPLRKDAAALVPAVARVQGVDGERESGLGGVAQGSGSSKKESQPE